MRKRLEFDFSAAIDGAVKDEAAKIGAAKDEVSDERTVKCKIRTVEIRGARLAQL
ncbi:unnamed protein product [Malus baccata var. baccata]